MAIRKKRPITEKRFDATIEELRARIKSDVKPFDDLSPRAKTARMARAEKDKEYFCNTYLPHYFFEPSAEFHDDLHDLADEPLVAVGAPRGFAKSTHFSFAEPIIDICYLKEKFIIIVSDSADQATDFTRAIKIEFEENPRIRNDFGDLSSSYWNDDDFVANGIRVKSRGRGQKIRGLKHKQYRPTKFIGDDIENDINVESPSQRKKTLNWILRAVRGGLEPSGSKMFIIGTILHYDSALANLTNHNKHKKWTKRVYRAITDGKSIWPSRWPLSVLEREKEIMGTVSFNQEFQNDPVDEETQLFKEEYIKYYDPLILPENLDVIGFLDASLGKNEKSDYQAFITIGVAEGGTIYVLDAELCRVSPKGIVDKMFAKFKLYDHRAYGVPDTLFEAVFKAWIDEESKMQRIYIPTVPVAQKLEKAKRISRISPLVENGTILFRRDQTLLIEQLVHFPKDHDDGPDALEGAVYLARGNAPAATGQKDPEPDSGRSRRKRMWDQDARSDLKEAPVNDSEMSWTQRRRKAWAA